MNQPTNTPSKNAVRAAEKAIKELGLLQEGAAHTFTPDAKDLARIIDQETGVKGLVEALEKINKIFNEEDEGHYMLQLIRPITEKALREVGE
jgi:hypothetical protein